MKGLQLGILMIVGQPRNNILVFSMRISFKATSINTEVGDDEINCIRNPAVGEVIVIGIGIPYIGMSACLNPFIWVVQHITGDVIQIGQKFGLDSILIQVEVDGRQHTMRIRKVW